MKHNVIAYNGKGKIGNMVGYTRGGVQMFRAWQPIVANPRTARQLLSRAKLAVASQLGRGLSALLRVSYGDDANSRVSPRNLFTKEIIPVSKDVITGQAPSEVTIKWEKLPVANGKLPMWGMDEPVLENPLNISVGISAPRKTADYHTSSSGEPRATFLYLAAILKDTKETAYSYLLVHDGTDWVNPFPENIGLNVPDHWQARQVEIYSFIKMVPLAANGIPTVTAPHRIPGEVTRSQYLGTGTIA